MTAGEQQSLIHLGGVKKISDGKVVDESVVRES